MWSVPPRCTLPETSGAPLRESWCVSQRRCSQKIEVSTLIDSWFALFGLERGPNVCLAPLRSYFSYFPWLCGIVLSQSHVLSIILCCSHGLVFFFPSSSLHSVVVDEFVTLSLTVGLFSASFYVFKKKNLSQVISVCILWLYILHPRIVCRPCVCLKDPVGLHFSNLHQAQAQT